MSVRVIAGSHRGRALIVPRGDTVRPTTGRAKAAMFSALDARGLVVGAAVLDLYAGVGGLGIEALSRGAERAVFVEQSPSALASLTTNLETCGLTSQSRVVRSDVARFLAGPPPSAPFGIVLADPPYGDEAAQPGPMLEALARPGWVDDAGAVVVERRSGGRSGRSEAMDGLAPPEFRVEWERSFGDTLVAFLTLTGDR
jgi:16S rRNA (guanine966-N2)-methyltransferase